MKPGSFVSEVPYSTIELIYCRDLYGPLCKSFIRVTQCKAVKIMVTSYRPNYKELTFDEGNRLSGDVVVVERDWSSARMASPQELKKISRFR